MKKILHIIHCDKFTNGYIEYMLKNQSSFEHYFIYIKNDKYKIIEKKNIIAINKGNKILKRNNKFLLEEADKIIVSGIFGIQNYLIFLPKRILKKVYLQFWGGDFYTYRNIKKFSKKHVKKIITQICINKCNSIINLIPDDYVELSKIFPNKKNHYTAIMPIESDNKIDYKYFLNMNKNIRNIIIGNSATKENHQIDILEALEHLKNYDLKIYCPLSYGDSDYAKEVICKGKKLFGDKFVGITEFMEYSKYVEFLSTCNVGIFNNDRQQAMGNINILLKMGKKVYLKEETSMYKDYQKHNVNVYSVKDLKNISYNDLFFFDDVESLSNNEKMCERENFYSECWTNILSL